MKDDKTSATNSRHRKQTSRMRLRIETVKTLQKLSAQAKIKRSKARKKANLDQILEEGTDVGKSKNTGPMHVSAPRPKKNKLVEPAKPPSKFRKRQLHKSWLPTHLYHAKRTHMTPPKEPLWRFAIPLTPTDKSYRATHRATASRGCVAWDTSYMSTIELEGVEASLISLLRGLGVEEKSLTGKSETKWRRGTRKWNGWINERDGERRPMAIVMIVWCLNDLEKATTAGKDKPSKIKEKRRAFLRVHPSAFLQVWNEVLKVAKMQRPPVMIEDLRFRLGSIEITGPESTEALSGVLNPSATSSDLLSSEDTPEKIWPLLAGVTNPASLPKNALLWFEINDPRLRHPPKSISKSNTEASSLKLLQILSSWSLDTTQKPPSIFDRNARSAASKSLSSQKAINRRKGEALPGAYPDPLPQDPRIPILLAASRSSASGVQGSWTVILPWDCVLPLWYSLMHYPLSSGGNPRFGGLQEERQIAFEQGTPWFPGDFPGTKAGWEWELMEREKRKAEWAKRPKGKRIEWESVDLGNGKKGEIGRGWACDWERLFLGPPADHPSPTSTSTDPNPSTSQRPFTGPSTPYHVLFPSNLSNAPSLTALTTISLCINTRGAPSPCARIYRLPTTNPALRSRWLALAHVPKAQKPHHRNPPSAPKNAPSHIRTQLLAASLLPSAAPKHQPKENQGEDSAKRPIQPGDPEYPNVPAEEDLIGFVTAGNFNLGKGKASAIGSVMLAKVCGSIAERERDRNREKYKEKEKTGAEDGAGNGGGNGNGSGNRNGNGNGNGNGSGSGNGNGNGNGNGSGSGSGNGNGSGNGSGNRTTKAGSENLVILRDAGQRVGRLARWEFV